VTEHTRTPWIVRSQVQHGKNKLGFYLAPDETCSAPAWGSNQANAAFIVKAVNSHDALVTALDNSSSLLVAMLHEKRPDDEIETQIIENRAALKGAA
jgi:hypothetical protein